MRRRSKTREPLAASRNQNTPIFSRVDMPFSLNIPSWLARVNGPGERLEENAFTKRPFPVTSKENGAARHATPKDSHGLSF